MRIRISYLRNKFFFLSVILISSASSASALSYSDQVIRDQKRIAAVCQSKLPVLVVDFFIENGVVNKYIDIDGDLVPDIAHGELVESFLKASGKSTLRYPVRDELNTSEFAPIFKNILEQVKSGKLRISAINLSQLSRLRIASLVTSLGENANASNLHELKENIINKIAIGMKSADVPEIEELVQIFSDFEKLGIPVIVAAGNDGSEFINTFSLFPGAISVGNQGLNGKPVATSSTSTLITIWKQGEYVAKRLSDAGIDLNNDGRADLEPALLSRQEPLVSKLRGKKLSDYLRKAPDDELSNLYSRKTAGGLEVLFKQLDPMAVYETKDLNHYFRRTDSPFAKALVDRAPYFNKNSNIGFTVDSQGLLQYDPLGDGDLRQVNLLSGTSYSAPSICR